MVVVAVKEGHCLSCFEITVGLCRNDLLVFLIPYVLRDTVFHVNQKYEYAYQMICKFIIPGLSSEDKVRATASCACTPYLVLRWMTADTPTK